jgi:hypothetical protein
MRVVRHQPQGVFGIRRQPADGVTSRAALHTANVTTIPTLTLKETNDGVPILCGVRRL